MRRRRTWLALILKIIRDRERCTANQKKSQKFTRFTPHTYTTGISLSAALFFFMIHDSVPEKDSST